MRQLLLATVALAPLTAHAATYIVVAPGTTPAAGQFASLNALAQKQEQSPFLQPGDVIQLPAGALATGDNLDKGLFEVGTAANPVTITSPPGQYTIVSDGGDALANGKAPFTINSSSVWVNGIVFLGNFGGSDGNGAGIRMGVNYGVKDAGGKYMPYNLKVTNSVFIGNGNGILADDCSDTPGFAPSFGPNPGQTSGACTVWIDRSWFSGNGDGSGLTHNLYIDRVDQLTFINNLSQNAFGGHLLKSRAFNTDIENNRFIDGALGYSNNDIDIPVGGNLTVKGNIIEKGPYGTGACFCNAGVMISYNEENYPPTLNNSGSNVDIENNTVIDDLSQTAHFNHTASLFQDGSWWTGKNGNPSDVTNDPNYASESVTIANNHFYSPVWTQANANTTMFRFPGPKDVMGSGNTWSATGAPALDTMPPVSWAPTTTTETLSVVANGLELDDATATNNPNSTDLSTFPQLILWWNGLPLTPAPAPITADWGASPAGRQAVTYQVPVINGSQNLAAFTFFRPGCCFSPAVNGQTGRLLNIISASLNGAAAQGPTFPFVMNVSTTQANKPALWSAPTTPPPTDTTKPTLQPINTLTVTAGTSAKVALKATDLDNTAAQLTYKLTAAPKNGTLQLNGTALAVGGTFTQADVAAGNVVYVAPSAGPVNDAFAFTVADPAANSVSGEQSIEVMPPVTTVAPGIKLIPGPGGAWRWK